MNHETTQLIDAALEASISPEDFSNLQDRLRNDPVAMKYYCEQSNINAQLEWELNTKSEQSEEPLKYSKNQSNPYKCVAAVASIAAVAAVSLHIFKPPNIEDTNNPTHTSSITTNSNSREHTSTLRIARITNSENAVWDNKNLQLGSWLQSGSIKLLSGKAEITYNSGARIILQGEVDLQSMNDYQSRLNKGKAVVHIPSHTFGFRLETPSSAFSDKDCTFALAVKSDSTEIHVIEGSLETSPYENIGSIATLVENDSLNLTKSSILSAQSLQYSVDSFDSTFATSEHHGEAEYLRWSFDTMTHNAFPENGNHEKPFFPAQVKQLDELPWEAQITAIKGKFGNALRLNGKGSYLATHFPGIAGAQERTVSCWVRIPQQTSIKHSYSFLSWGQAESLTGTKWQIAWNPAMDSSGTKGALRTEFGGGYVVGTTNLCDGKWHHIASVYLGGNSNDVSSQVLHYVDGQLESVSASKHLAINTQVAKNTSHATFIGKRLENDGFLTFKGDLDELHFFPSALTPSQIQNLYLHNRPPQSYILAYRKLNN